MRRAMMTAPAVSGGGGASVFPTSGLTWHVDPSDTGHRSIVSGKVDSLTDLVHGLVSTLPYGGGSGPPLQTANLNGFDTVRTSPGHSLWWRHPSPGIPTDPWSMFFIGDPRGGQGYGLGNGWTSTGSSMGCLSNSGNSVIKFWDGASGGAQPVAGPFTNMSDNSGATPGAFDILLLILSGGTYTMYKNGTLIYTVAGLPAETRTDDTIGYGISSPGEWGTSTPGDLGEAGIYDHALNSTERHDLFHSLGAKYAITVV